MFLHKSTIKIIDEFISALKKDITEKNKEYNELQDKTDKDTCNYNTNLKTSELLNTIRTLNDSSIANNKILDLRKESNKIENGAPIPLAIFICALMVVFCALSAVYLVPLLANPVGMLTLTIISIYAAVMFAGVGIFVFGYRHGNADRYHNLANALEEEVKFDNLALRTKNIECAKQAVDLSKQLTSWHKITPLLLVIEKIELADDNTKLQSAKQEFLSKRHWTYMGTFPLDKNLNELESAISSFVTEREKNLKK